MAVLTWDTVGERYYHAGVDKVVLFPLQDDKTYSKGVAWSGVTSIGSNPTGADSDKKYADNIEYLNIISTEEYEGSIGAYDYPDEFMECNGMVEVKPGVYATQQTRKTFGLCYRTKIGSDTESIDAGYELHFVYGAIASPSSQDYETISDSIDPQEMSWDFTTTPVAVTTTVNGKALKPMAHMVVNSLKVDSATLQKIEEKVYGSASSEAELPLPDELYSLISE